MSEDRIGERTEGIDPRTRLGVVRLAVGELERSVAFYRDVLGFGVQSLDEAQATLGVGEDTLLELEELPGAPARPKNTTGLYHYAILVPDRGALGRSLRRLMGQDYGLWGASDHLVSEALYLDDPDGNGIEIYHDRPREEWSWDGGEVRMAVDPLDFDGLLNSPGAEAAWSGLAAGTTIGHVHLHVGDLAEAERFFHRTLGFEKTAEFAGQALFLSAGGYHHHLGVNIWAGRDAPPPPPGSAGLVYYELRVPAEELPRLTDRLQTAGVRLQATENRIVLADPWGTGIVVSEA